MYKMLKHVLVSRVKENSDLLISFPAFPDD